MSDIDEDIKKMINRGIKLLQKDLYDKAHEIFEEVIRFNPVSVEGWFYEGCALAFLGKNKEALNCFKKVDEIQPNNGWLHMIIRLGKKEGFDIVKRAVKNDPDLIENLDFV